MAANIPQDENTEDADENHAEYNREEHPSAPSEPSGLCRRHADLFAELIEVAVWHLCRWRSWGEVLSLNAKATRVIFTP